MIIFPPPNEKELDGLNNTTQVYYATMPSPRPTGEGDINGLADRLDNDLYLDEEPPAYDAHEPAIPVPAGDASPNLFKGSPSSDNRSGAPGSSPRASRGVNNSGGSSRARRVPAFEPLVMHSKSKKIEDGFFAMLPPTDVQPHPFTERDVSESDWKKFLSDLQTSARLSSSGASSPSQPGERANLFQNMGNMFRSFSANASGKQADQENHRGPAALVDTWNDNFFHRRGLEVVLAKGSHKLNGNKTLPPPDCLPIDEEVRNTAPRVIRGSSPSQNVPPFPSVPPMPTWPPWPPIPAMPAMPMHSMPTMPGVFANAANGDHKVHHSHSTSSLSSSDSDLDSDSESDSENERYDHGPGTHHAASPFSRAELRAEKRARRAEHRMRRAERRKHRHEKRQERKDLRYARKWARWESKVAMRGMGWGWGRGMPMGGCYAGRGGCHAARGGCHAATWSTHGFRGPVGGGPLGLVQGIASLMNKEDDGYYRLIVIDRV